MMIVNGQIVRQYVLREEETLCAQELVRGRHIEGLF